MAAAKMSDISMGQYLGLSPAMQSTFRLQKNTELVLVTNLPPYNLKVGDPFNSIGFIYPSKDPAYGKFMDYGKHWSNSLPTDRVYYQVRTNGVIAIHPKPKSGAGQGAGKGAVPSLMQ